MEEWLVKYYPLLRVSLTLSLQERKGWRSDEVMRALASHQCGPDSNRGVDAQG